MFLRNLSLSRKLLLAFCVVILASAATSTLIFTNLMTLREASKSASRSQTLSQKADRLVALTVDQQNALRKYLLGGGDAAREAYDAAGAAFEQEWTAFHSATSQPAQRDRLEKLKVAVEAWRRDVAAPEFARGTVAFDPASSALDLTEVRTLGGELGEAAEERVAVRAAEHEAALSRSVTVLGAGGLVLILLSVAMGMMLARLVGRPIVAMTAAMARLAEGDKSVVIPAVGQKDEVGRMADAVVAFKDAALEKDRLEAEAASHRSMSENERLANEAEKARVAEEDRIALTALAGGLSA
ncbi:CHASE3 domain-containing protein, partial [Brevundimonas sp.]|uniref:CHASE3 domain-containing protein n=1 Tax=Brevundimonas sp. TaxID=1871086 RepID=UPI0037C07DA5